MQVRSTQCCQRRVAVARWDCCTADDRGVDLWQVSQPPRSGPARRPVQLSTCLPCSLSLNSSLSAFGPQCLQQRTSSNKYQRPASRSSQDDLGVGSASSYYPNTSCPPRPSKALRPAASISRLLLSPYSIHAPCLSRQKFGKRVRRGSEWLRSRDEHKQIFLVASAHRAQFFRASNACFRSHRRS